MFSKTSFSVNDTVYDLELKGNENEIKEAK